MTASPEPCKTLSEALVALQAQLPRVAKDQEAKVTSQRTGKTHSYKYADLFDVSEAILPLMTTLGLAFTARPTLSGNDRFVLLYSLMHVSGDEISGEYPLPTSGTPQEIGSAITYARRYALCAVTGLAPGGDDDDGKAAEDAAQDDAKRDAAGRMTRAQQQDHTALRQLDHPRSAERSTGPADDDPWAGPTPEEKPGSSNSRQHQRLGILYGQAGITDRADRLADMTNRVGREITSAKDLSYVEAEQAAAEIEKLAKK